MLQGEERVRSFAHRNLKQLERYREIKLDEKNVPSELDDETILGVYTDTHDNQLFITVRGIYDDSSDTFIAYDDVACLSTNVETLGKLKANQIHVELRSGETISLFVHGESFLAVNGREFPTNDIWTIYTFLIRVCSV